MTLEYFGVRHTANYKEVKNVFPQVLFDTTYVDEADIVRRIMNVPISPDVVFRFNLKKKTIATDILSQGDFSSFGLLISKKAYDCLKGLYLENVQFIDSRVKKGEDELQYYWLHPTKNYFDYIDYSKTIFVLSDKASRRILYEMNMKNKDVFLQRLGNKSFDKSMTGKEGIFFLPGYSIKSHIILLPRIHLSLFISKTLKDILIANSISGIYIADDPLNMICE